VIEAAYTQERLPVWTGDEGGPYQTLPYPGSHGHPAGQPVRYPHEYVRDGPAKRLMLFHPTSGQVRGKGVRRAPNAVLHPWLQAELTTTLAALPEPEILPLTENRRCWERWQEGLTVRITLRPPTRSSPGWRLRHGAGIAHRRRSSGGQAAGETGARPPAPSSPRQIRRMHPPTTAQGRLRQWR